MEVLRSTLLPRLDGPAPLVVVQGLSGFGRTTLLRQWWRARRTAGPLLIDLGTVGHPSEVWSRILHMMARNGRRIDLDAVSLLDRGAASSTEVVERAILDQVAPTVLLLGGPDDVVSCVRTDLWAVLRAHPSIRAVLVATEAAPMVADAQSHGIVAQVVDDQDLLFDRDELRALLVERELPAVPEQIEALERLTGRVPALAATALDQLGRGLRMEELDRERLAGLHRVSAPRLLGTGLQRVMATGSTLTRIAPAMAMSLDAADLSAHLLRVSVAGLGSVEFDDAGQVAEFRWYEGARRQLLDQLRLELGVAKVVELQQVVAGIALRSGRPGVAAVALIEAGDLDSADKVVQESFWLCWGEQPAVWAALSALPSRRLDGRPALQLLRLLVSEAKGAAGPGGSRRLRRLAEIELGQATIDPAARMMALSRAALAAAQGGDLDLSRDAVRRWIELAQAMTPVAAGAVSAGLVVGRIAIRLLELDEAVVAFEYVLDLLDSDPDPEASLSARLGIAAVTRFMGRVAVSGEPDLLVAAARSRQPFDQEMAGIARALRLLDRGEQAAAAEVTAALCATGRPLVERPLIAVTALIAHLLMGKTAMILSIQQWMSFAADESPDVAADFVEVLSARALGVASRARPLQNPAPTDQISRLTQVIRLVAMEDLPAAAEALRLSDAPLPYVRFRSLVRQIAALVALRMGDPAFALLNLEQAYQAQQVQQLAPLGMALGSHQEIRALVTLAAEAGSPGLTGWLEQALAYRPVAWSDRGEVELTAREAEILALLRQSMGNSEMAQRLTVSVNTIKFHRAKLYRKLGATSRSELLMAADRAGLMG